MQGQQGGVTEEPPAMFDEALALIADVCDQHVSDERYANAETRRPDRAATLTWLIC
jgi:hypothetical protein